ncbi:hypothetical protein HDU76_003726 [Blyttiomyces sp. JEL0837]|nr:hypothetical protein HDU76_003726 [Blyttiomyces sp. JEL0837]
MNKRVKVTARKAPDYLVSIMDYRNAIAAKKASTDHHVSAMHHLHVRSPPFEKRMATDLDMPTGLCKALYNSEDGFRFSKEMDVTALHCMMIAAFGVKSPIFVKRWAREGDAFMYRIYRQLAMRATYDLSFIAVIFTNFEKLFSTNEFKLLFARIFDESHPLHPLYDSSLPPKMSFQEVKEQYHLDIGRDLCKLAMQSLVLVFNSPTNTIKPTIATLNIGHFIAQLMTLASKEEKSSSQAICSKAWNLEVGPRGLELKEVLLAYGQQLFGFGYKIGDTFYAKTRPIEQVISVPEPSSGACEDMVEISHLFYAENEEINKFSVWRRTLRRGMAQKLYPVLTQESGEEWFRSSPSEDHLCFGRDGSLRVSSGLKRKRKQEEDDEEERDIGQW